MKRRHAQANLSKRGDSIQDLAAAATAAGRPGRDGLADRLIQDVAAGVGVATDQTRPAAATRNSRWRTIPVPRLLPHTIQLCIRCKENPAGFWVSRDNDQTVRRPWCLSCCQDLDPACYHIKAFDP